MRPQGNPPKGTRSRSASMATHQHEIQIGQPGSRTMKPAPAPNSAVNAIDIATTSTYASGPMTRSHGVRSPKNARPKAAPVRAPTARQRRVPRCCVAARITNSSAPTAAGAMHPRVVGRKREAARAAPASPARTTGPPATSRSAVARDRRDVVRFWRTGASLNHAHLTTVTRSGSGPVPPSVTPERVVRRSFRWPAPRESARAALRRSTPRDLDGRDLRRGT